MTNAELLAKIKAEIKRLFNRSCLKRNLARKNNYSYSEIVHRAEMDVCSQLLYFISDIEKSLPKVDCEGLNEEINRTYHDGSVANTSDIDHVTYENIAEYFYDLGCRRAAEKYDELEYNRQRASGSSEIPNDLEEASSKFATHTASNGVSVEFLEEKLSFQEGAKWARKQMMKDGLDAVKSGQPDKIEKTIAGVFVKYGMDRQKELMMKNAKDGWIDEECVIILNDGTLVDLQPDYEKKPAFEFEYAQDVRVIVLPKEN